MPRNFHQQEYMYKNRVECGFHSLEWIALEIENPFALAGKKLFLLTGRPVKNQENGFNKQFNFMNYVH